MYKFIHVFSQPCIQEILAWCLSTQDTALVSREGALWNMNV